MKSIRSLKKQDWFAILFFSIVVTLLTTLWNSYDGEEVHILGLALNLILLVVVITVFSLFGFFFKKESAKGTAPQSKMSIGGMIIKVAIPGTIIMTLVGYLLSDNKADITKISTYSGATFVILTLSVIVGKLLSNVINESDN